MAVMGRPTLYTQELADEICSWISSGKSLRSFCKMHPEAPEFQTIIRWTFEREDFYAQYIRAREIQAEVWAEEVVDISDDNNLDKKFVMRGDDVVETVDHDHVNRARLRVDSRKWIASRLLPKRYGDQANLRLSGADGGPIETKSAVTVNIITAIPEPDPPVEGE